MTDVTLSLVAALDRSLAWYRGGSVRYVVAEIKADRPSARPVSTKALNLALVIDASGSMSGEKLASAKRAAVEVIRSLGARDLLSVVSFADDVQVHLDATPCSDGRSDQAVRMVEAIETRGSTNLSGGWLTGAECVAGAMGADQARVNRVVVLSDGLANAGVTDVDVLAEHATQLRLRGITTSAVGIGDDYSAAFLQSLAEHGGGQMHDAERAEEIDEVLLGELRESQAIAFENVSLSLHTPPGVDAELVGFYPVKGGVGKWTATISGIGSGRSRQAVFRLKLPGGAPGDRMGLRLAASGTRAGETAHIPAAPVELSIQLAHGSENGPQKRDLGVSIAVGQAWHALVVRTVARLNREGDRRKSRHYLERELRYFQRYAQGMPELEALARELVLLLRSIDKMWNERTRKEMELSAYKRAMGEADLRSAPRAPWTERLQRE